MEKLYYFDKTTLYNPYYIQNDKLMCNSITLGDVKTVDSDDNPLIKEIMEFRDQDKIIQNGYLTIASHHIRMFKRKEECIKKIATDFIKKTQLTSKELLTWMNVNTPPWVWIIILILSSINLFDSIYCDSTPIEVRSLQIVIDSWQLCCILFLILMAYNPIIPGLKKECAIDQSYNVVLFIFCIGCSIGIISTWSSHSSDCALGFKIIIHTFQPFIYYGVLSYYIFCGDYYYLMKFDMLTVIRYEDDCNDIPQELVQVLIKYRLRISFLINLIYLVSTFVFLLIINLTVKESHNSESISVTVIPILCMLMGDITLAIKIFGLHNLMSDIKNKTINDIYGVNVKPLILDNFMIPEELITFTKFLFSSISLGTIGSLVWSIVIIK